MADALGTYRKQNGITLGGGYDPQVVDWIKQAAGETGADPAALLATSLMENGARLGGKPGDNGTSFGPFQFHIGGALGNHSPAWASTYAAVLNRAQEFARLKVHGGVGAAAVQRPLDRTTYAAGVNGLLARADQILGRTPSAVPGQLSSPQTAAHKQLAKPTPAVDPYATMDFINALLGDSSIERLATLGQRLQESQAAKRAPSSQPAGPPPSATGSSPQRGAATTSNGIAPPGGDPVAVRKATLIGTPYQGTHTLYGNWESDNAIDIKLPVGSPVYAASDGTIGSQFGHINTGDAHMAGMRLHLDSPGQNYYYQHLQSAVVKPGQKVKRGQLLGYTGALNHLHFAVQKGDPRSYVK